MAKIKSSGHREANIPNASMSDIAFLLLLFFMVTTVFVREQVRIKRYEYPVASRNVERMKERGKTATIYVTKEGKVFIDDVERDVNDVTSTKSINGIMAEKRKDVPDLKVCIRSHRDTQYSEIRSVMMLLQQANTREVVFEAQKRL